MTERLTYTVDEAAALIGVHSLTLRAAIERGEVPARRVGRRVLVPHAALKAWLATGEVRETAKPISRHHLAAM